MTLLKKLLLTAFVSLTTLTMMPVAMAAPAGKIEKATAAEVVVAINDAISLSEEALAALQGGSDKDTVLALLKKTKQASKRIESNIVDRLRSKANSRIAKARSAIRKDDSKKGVAYLTEAVKIFKEVKAKHAAF